MKKMILTGGTSLLLCIGASFMAQSSDTSELSLTKLANMEALAYPDGPQVYKWKRNTDKYGCTYNTWVVDGNGDLCRCREVSND